MVQIRSLNSPEPQSSRGSKAARFNAHVLKKLHKVANDDPEVDLLAHFPTRYSERLVEMTDSSNRSPKRSKTAPNKSTEPVGDIRDSLSSSGAIYVRFPLSATVTELLETPSQTAKRLPDGLSQRVVDLLQASEPIWTAPFARQKAVFKCSQDVAVKVIRNMEDYTEYTALQYLEEHKPDIPAPRPHGLLIMNEKISLVFVSYVPSLSLGKVWHTLDAQQKSSISDQLNTIILGLRSLPFPEGAPLGGVAGEGCKDVRRHCRKSTATVTNVEEFESFLLSGSRPGGNVFADILRQLSPSITLAAPRIVMTHGDIRPDNIAVKVTEDNQYVISGLLDWEYSGFYPDYYESVRCTNCLWPYEDDDWYLYLPECVSPKQFAHWWLLDRVREARVL